MLGRLVGLCICSHACSPTRTAPAESHPQEAEELRVIAAVVEQTRQKVPVLGHAPPKMVCVSKTIKADPRYNALQNSSNLDAVLETLKRKPGEHQLKGLKPRMLGREAISAALGEIADPRGCRANVHRQFYRVQFSGRKALVFYDVYRPCSFVTMVAGMDKQPGGWRLSEQRLIYRVSDFDCSEEEPEYDVHQFGLRGSQS